MTESTIDSLLARSLPDNPALQRAFIKAAGLDQNGAWLNAAAVRSPKRLKASGQTDIGLNFGSELSLLIENKIFSPFTANQFDRYDLECAALMATKNIQLAIPVLFCPQSYHQRSKAAKRFTHFLFYEDILKYFEFERAILEKAIRRCELGWVADEMPEVTENFSGYQLLLHQKYPDIRMITEPDNKPERSRTVRFEIAVGSGTNRSEGITILHQWREARAKILFDGWGKRKDRTQVGERMSVDGKAFGLKLDPNRTDSLGLYVPTPQLENIAPWDGQIGEAEAGIDMVAALAGWVRSHEEMWQGWKRDVS